MSPIPNTVARRYILGRPGLWPGRRWAGKDGTIQALRDIECVQMDPLNVVARSHDLALWGRVLDYRPEHLGTVMYRDREFFDYGGNLRIYPMRELPYWRVTMRRKGKEARWANFAKQYRALLETVRAELRTRGPLGNRDVAGQTRVNNGFWLEDERRAKDAHTRDVDGSAIKPSALRKRTQAHVKEFMRHT
ncbi:MAG: DNA glycosylase AlkZ-like family protein [Armatimonadota bacterium]